MNDISKVTQRSVEGTSLLFGISPLHSHIRFYECLLHVAYRLDFNKWQARSTEEKTRVANRKQHIQTHFRREIGLIVDLPTQGGGTTNDGNSARKFFANPAISARITGIKEEIIVRFSVILEVISSGREINCDLFRLYCTETAEIFVENYWWYPLPASVHKVLIHGWQIMQNSSLPVGMLSEEPQEARNKDYRYYREHHTRKDTREHTNEDLLKILLVSSDPVITSFCRNSKKPLQKLSTDTLKLLASQAKKDNSESGSDDE